MANTELATLATEVLTAVEDAFDAAAVALPARRFVSSGQPADDCPELVVWLSRIFTGTPAAEVTEPERRGIARTLELLVRLTRCVPVTNDRGLAPTADAIGDSAAQIATDMWVLTQGLLELYESRDFLDQCQDWTVGACTALESLGGVGGCELLMRIQVHGVL